MNTKLFTPPEISVIENTFSKAPPAQTTIDSIVRAIRGDLRDLTAEYRTVLSRSAPEAKKFKMSRFPAAYPCVRLSDRKVNDDAIPTGIYQFDLDLKDNFGVDISEVVKELKTIPSLVLLFRSPSRGVKFWIGSDFCALPGDNIEITMERFSAGYSIVQEHVQGFLSLRVVLDPAVRSMKQSCYLSYDPDAHFNPQAEILGVAHRIQYTPSRIIQAPTVCSNAMIQSALDAIPRDLGYQERLPINFAVLNTLGEEGIGILMSHWSTENREKLLRDLRGMLKGTNRQRRITIATLFKHARNNGWKYSDPSKQDTDSETKRPEPISDVQPIEVTDLVPRDQIPELLDIQEARDKVKEVLQEIIDGEDAISLLEVGVGLGKTQGVVEILSKLPGHHRVLFLAGSHKLLAEIRERYEAIQPSKALMKPKVIQIYGKDHLCTNPVKAQYDAAGVSMPVPECKGCFRALDDSCQYINQFRDPFANIRFMAFNELLGDPAFFNRIETQVRTKGGNAETSPVKAIKHWKPSLIIVDDCTISIKNVVETAASDWKSVTRVLAEDDINTKEGLLKAIMKHGEKIYSDYEEMCEGSRLPQFISTDQYLRDVAKAPKKSDILRALYRALKISDIPRGLRVSGNALVLSELENIHDRFEGVKTIFLDGTASHEVVQAAYPGINIRTVHARKNPAVKIWAANGVNITRNFCAEPRKADALIQHLRGVIQAKGYKKVGIVTYKNIGGLDWAQKVKDETGALHVGYFGNIRGYDYFKECDALFIVGRHAIPASAFNDYSYALWGEQCRTETEAPIAVFVPVRGVHDKFYGVRSYYPEDSMERAIYEHYCRSESIQAVGRARYFTESNVRDVYFYSTETLGLNIEIDGFFTPDIEIPTSDTRATMNRSLAANRANGTLEKYLSLLAAANKDRIRNRVSDLVDLGISKNYVDGKDRRAVLMSTAGYYLEGRDWVRLPQN